MRIEIYGHNNDSTHRIAELSKRLVKKLELQDVSVKLITEPQRIMARHIMKVPALFVNDKKICEGRIPGESEYLEYLFQFKKNS